LHPPTNRQYVMLFFAVKQARLGAVIARNS
jgi:hypothetical protein